MLIKFHIWYSTNSNNNSFKIKCNVFLVLKVNCSSSVFNYNPTQFNIKEDQKMSKLS